MVHVGESSYVAKDLGDGRSTGRLLSVQVLEVLHASLFSFDNVSRSGQQLAYTSDTGKLKVLRI